MWEQGTHMFKSKPSPLDALDGQQATLRTSGQTGSVTVASVNGKKLTLEFGGGPRTGDAILTCDHPDQGLIKVRGTMDKKGVLSVKDVDTAEQRRLAYRIAVTCEVEVILTSGTTLDCMTSDLSVGGLRIASCFRLRVDDKVTVRVTLGDESLLVKAEVARAEPRGGCGLRFVEMSNDDDLKLSRFITELQRGNLSAMAR
ncbi:MAG: PilZ domain-containing protein [Solirubrobacteraceae bacterium]|nr:PilZ domain-containing protein [Solirubrobacteraceae bacterium]